MGEANHVDHKVELAIAISFLVMGIAIVCVVVFHWIRGEFFEDQPETNDTLDFSKMLGIPMWLAIVEHVRDSHRGLLGYLERYWTVGQHRDKPTDNKGNRGQHKSGSSAQSKRDDSAQQQERLRQAQRMNREAHNRTSEH